MRKRIKGALLVLAAFAAVALPAFPAHATSCGASDPTVDYVVCDVIYPPVAWTACHAKLLCY